MSGLFGLIDSHRATELDRTLSAMADRMSHRPWYRRSTWIDAANGVALGCLGIGILNQYAQPVTNPSGSVALFLCGEFFKWDGAPAGSHSPRDRFRNDAEYALHLYEQYGDVFARYLATAFAIAIYDRDRRIVLLATDRFGLYPVYFSHRNGRLAFAPEVKGVLYTSIPSRELDDVALAQYMRFQQVLGTRTFFTDVRALPNASILTLDLATGDCRIEPYWSFDQVPPECANITFGEAADEATRLMRQSVERRLRGDHRTGLYLSGGLDSRTILAAFPQQGPRPTTLTYGVTGCADAVYAARVAARARTDHHYFEYTDGTWVQAYVDFHLTLTEGVHTWVHLHGIDTLETARNWIDINLTGLVGDSLLGGADVIASPAQVTNDLACISFVFQMFNQDYNWPGISEAEEHFLYTPRTHARLAGVAFDSLQQEIEPYLKYDPIRRIDYFGLIESDLRHYSHYLTFTRSHLDVRHPYLDYDLVDFLWSIPTALRSMRQLEIAVLNRLSPSLALVPTARDRLLPTQRHFIRGAHQLMHRSKRRFNRHIFSLFADPFPLPTDYEGWLRTDLRAWAESILFDRRTLDRGLFNPDFLRSIWARHLSRREEWTVGKIAPIMTYELMLRQLHDTS